MNKVLIAILAAGLLCCVSLAQDTPQPQAPAAAPQSQAPEPTTSQPQSQQQLPEPQPTPQTQQSPAGRQQAPAQNPGESNGNKRIAPGSVIPVLLTKTVDAKKAKPGDEVVVKVTQDLKTNSGELIFAKDTKVIGHVTEAQPRNKEQKESQVGIAFDRVVKDGNEMQLPMSIQAIIGPQNNQNNAGGNNDSSYPTASGTTAGGTSGRAGGMAGAPSAGQPSTQNTNMPSGGTTDTQAAKNSPPEITTQTQGVIGISNLKLEPAPSANQGSVVTSEKNNVKIESGTMMLLRVNQ